MVQGLRAQFLDCKEAWLAGQVAELEPGGGAGGAQPSDAYDALKRLTDVHRTQLSDAVNQFRSVFLDDIGQVLRCLEAPPQRSQGFLMIPATR